MHCSNPSCKRVTSGPQEDSETAINIGVAAHIAAASPGGTRYNVEMSSSQRSSAKNGIWLCQSCAKLIDNDEQKYTVDLLHRWKNGAEANAQAALERARTNLEEEQLTADVALIRFYSQCFDRPAFQDEFRHEGSTEHFDKAMEDTITAINTGALRARDGALLSQAKGKSYLINPAWRETLDTIVDLLRAIRSRYREAVNHKDVYINDRGDGTHFYVIHDRAVGAWMDHTRAEIIRLFSQLCKEANLPPLRFPRQSRWQYFGDY